MSKLDEKLAERVKLRDSVVSGRRSLERLRAEKLDLQSSMARIEAQLKVEARRLVALTPEIEALLHADAAGVIGIKPEVLGESIAVESGAAAES